MKKKGFEGIFYVFSAYGCALLESQNASGVYVYTAVNLKTGKTKLLSRRKRKLEENGFEAIAVKIKDSEIRGDGRFATEKVPGEITPCQKLVNVGQHIFTEVLPSYGYAVRQNQIELMEHMLNITERRGITLAESEVGTGKTHAYLIAAVLAKRGRLNDMWLQKRRGNHNLPVVISTSSIALQKAILRDYIPELSRILIENNIIKKPLTAVIRKGKEHYICEKRIVEFHKFTDEPTKSRLEPFMDSESPFDLTDADSLTIYMKRHICVLGVCSENCSFRYGCRYTDYIENANDFAYDFQITNHNYFLADRRHKVNGKRSLIPDYQLVIVDEAHKFLQAARSMYGLELTDAEFSSLEAFVHGYVPNEGKKNKAVHDNACTLREQGEKLFKHLLENPSLIEADDEAERFPAVMDNKTLNYLSNIESIAENLAKDSKCLKVKDYLKDVRSKAVHWLGELSEDAKKLRKQSKLIYWLEKSIEGEKITHSLCAIPKDIDVMLHNDLWSGGVPIILTSGTLSASGDFTRTLDTLGLNHVKDKVSSINIKSPFDYEKNCMLYISEKVPFPDNKNQKYITAVAYEIERLVYASHGRAAVLFTSYNVMGKVHAILKKRNLPFPLFRLERGGSNAIRKFKESGNGVLLASGAMWEGIDIPGDTLSMLIIVKLPFAVPDPINEYEQTLYSSMDEYKTKAIIPDMLIKFTQGFGRLLRTEKDTGVVAVLDSRAREGKAYHKSIISTVPRCKTTSSIKEVKNFFRNIKEPNYFNK